MRDVPVVLQLIDSFGVGGAQQRYFNDLSHFGPEFEHRPCAVFDDGAPMQAAFLSMPYLSLGLKRLRDLPLGLARLAQLVRTDPAIKLVHTQLFAADTIGRIAGTLCGRPVVSTVQSAMHEPDSGLYSQWRHRTDQATAPWATRLVAVSEFVRRSTHRRLRVRLDRITVIPNTVDTHRVRPDSGRRTETRAALGLGPAAFAWLTVGRLHPAKGLTFLLDAFVTVLARHSSSVMLIAGRGPFLGELQQQAAAARIDGSVRFLGERTDVQALLDAADGFVFPSLSEGLPVAALEAMAMEKPCVLSRIGPHEEMIEQGVSGVLVAPRDAGQLAGGMSRIQESPAYGRRLGVCARAEVTRRFEAEAGARRLERLYEDVLSSR